MKIWEKRTKAKSARLSSCDGCGKWNWAQFCTPELARRGGTVVCADINLSAAEQTVALIQNQYQTSAFAVRCDVGCAEKVQTLAEQAEQLMGHPTTLLINNAGVGLGGKFHELSLQDWQWCMQSICGESFMVVIILCLNLSSLRFLVPLLMWHRLRGLPLLLK